MKGPVMSDMSHQSFLSAPGEPGSVEALPAEPPPVGQRRTIVGRSPGQLAWSRLRRDRTAMISGGTLIMAMLLALAAPLVQRLTGIDPTDKFADRLNGFG